MASQTRSRTLLFVAAVFCVAGCHSEPTSRPSVDEDETVEPIAADSPAKVFEGSYRYAGGEEEKAARDKAIDDVVSGMSVFSRGIAKGKLVDSNPIAEEVSVAGANGKLKVSMDEREYAAPIDGQPAKVKGITGDEMDMHFKIAADLEQTFAAEGRGRVNTFHIDGDKLTIMVKVHSDQLPKELVYELTYKRI